MLGYNFSSWAGYAIGALYLLFAFVEMYVMMPLTVCPNCVYYRMADSRCISGLNLVSKRVVREGDPKDFAKRAEGLLCNNNLYMVALILPILAMIPALILNFSIWLLIIFLAVVVLLLFRFFVIFSRIACIHCYAKYKCPQAGQMGVRDL
jgi:antibiotic biosynthesis monooxygenase (ABM) superfamily enzyme